MTTALVFPGQGSQTIGMGLELKDAFPEAKEVFQEVDEALNQKLSAIVFNGQPEDLQLTANAQPAIMAVSMAVLRVLEKQGGFDLSGAAFLAGHSLGEYSALAAGRAFTLSDTAKLLRLRGDAMQAAVPVGEGSMAALIGVDFDQAKAIAESAAQGETCAAANDNAPGQVVISGSAAAIDRALAMAAEQGFKRSVKLNVSAPFHCQLMQPAAYAMREALGVVTLQAPAVPLVANVIASQTQDPNQIRDLLVQQVTGTVRWRESVLYMKEQGVTQLLEIGQGNVLTGLARRIDKDLPARSIGTPADIDAFMKG